MHVCMESRRSRNRKDMASLVSMAMVTVTATAMEMETATQTAHEIPTK